MIAINSTTLYDTPSIMNLQFDVESCHDYGKS